MASLDMARAASVSLQNTVIGPVYAVGMYLIRPVQVLAGIDWEPAM